MDWANFAVLVLIAIIITLNYRFNKKEYLILSVAWVYLETMPD
jgi:hypothetical protein